MFVCSIYNIYYIYIIYNTYSIYDIYIIYNIYLPSRTRTPRTLAPGPRPASTDPPWTSSRIWKLRYEICENIRRMNLIKQLLNNFMKFWCVHPEYFFTFLYLQGITLKGERALPPWLNMQKVSPFGTDTNTTREWTTSAEKYYYNQKNHQLFLYPNIIFHFLFSRLHSGTDLSELAVSL